MNEKIAIIGTGIAGMGCGHFLHEHYDLEFYEQNNYVGGHTNTTYVTENGKQIPVDTGFIVFNEVTYPNLVRLFKRLRVDVKPTDMSFGVQHLPTGLEYSSKNLFAQKWNYLNPRFFKMLLQITRFFSESQEILENARYADYSLDDYVKEKKYSADFIYKYIVPMSSALWSTPTDITLKYPIRVLVQFFKNHGLLGIDTQFQWYTVDRGSWQYRDKLITPFRHKIQTGNAAVHVERSGDHVEVMGSNGITTRYDKVIFACHADQALKIIADPTDLERTLLQPFEYQKNVATLHTDASIMPKIKSTWSAWNYRVAEVNGKITATTIYDMNILQQVSDQKSYFISINDPCQVDPSKIIRQIHYEHPVFTPETANVQPALDQLNENGVSYFCGSYFRFGFHEDAFTSAVDLCRGLLGQDPWELKRVENPALWVTT